MCVVLCVCGCFSVVYCITIQYTNTLLCHFSSDFLILFCLIFQSCTNVPLRDCAHSSFQEKFWRYKEEKGGYSRGGRKVIFFSDVCLSILWSVMITWSSGSKGGDNGSNIQFLRVSDFGYWLKGNVQEFIRFCLTLGTSASMPR